MIYVLSDQGDQLGTADGGKIPRGDIGRRHKGQEGSGTIYQPKAERHSKGGCATPGSLLLLRVILWGQTWVQIPTLQFSGCVNLSTLLNLSERHILLYKIEMIVSTSLSGYQAQRDHFCKTLNTLVCT